MSLGSNAPAQLQSEAGLPDPRFSREQHEVGPPLPRGEPRPIEFVQFAVATHERRFRDGCAIPALRFLAVGFAGAQLPVHLRDYLTGFHLEIALQHFCVPVVAAQRRASVAAREVCFHQDSSGHFVGRLHFDDALGMPDRRFVVAALGSLVPQPRKDLVRLGSELRALSQDRLVVASWKEVA